MRGPVRALPAARRRARAAARRVGRRRRRRARHDRPARGGAHRPPPRVRGLRQGPPGLSARRARLHRHLATRR